MSKSLNDFMQSVKFLPKEQAREKLRRFYKSTTKKLGLEYIMVTDDEIKAKDFSAVVKFFSRFDKSWRAYQGKVMVNIDGYNDVEDELFEIPEVVAFFKELYLTHPHYLGYLDIPTESFDLAVRFLADDVIIMDMDDIENIPKSKYTEFVLPDMTIDDFAYFQSRMNSEVFEQVTQGTIQWYEAKGELKTAFELLKRISNAVVMDK